MDRGGEGEYPMGEMVGDFVVRRADQLDVRLHPQKARHKTTGMKEALPVWGHASQWSPGIDAPDQHRALAPSQDQAAMGSTPAGDGSYHGLSQADKIGRAEAVAYVDSEVAAWMAMQHPRPTFRADITSGANATTQGHFHWPYYFQCRAWFPTHFRGFTVDRVEIAWSDQRGHPVFVGQRSDGEAFTVNPKARTQAAEFEWGDSASHL